MKQNMFQTFELWLLDCVIELLSQSTAARSFWQQTYTLFSGHLLFVGLLISVSSFMGLISGYFFYMYALGAR
jgi:hypothetical protein